MQGKSQHFNSFYDFYGVTFITNFTVLYTLKK